MASPAEAGSICIPLEQVQLNKFQMSGEDLLLLACIDYAESLPNCSSLRELIVSAVNFVSRRRFIWVIF
jgi:hypothetical protein